MRKFNLIVVFNKDLSKGLFCIRAKEPYKGKYNFVGGKVEENETNDEAAYRELFEETGISKKDIKLDHFMDLNYFKYDNNLQVYYGILTHNVDLVEEKNKLKWVELNEELLDNNKFGGNYNIPHIIAQIKVFLKIESSNNLEFSKNIPELSVTNLENSLNFYKTAGFKVEYDRPESKFAFISLGEIQFMLQEITDNDKWDVAPLSYPFGNGVNFQLKVDDLDEIYNSFKNSNYKITFDIEENWYRQDDKLLGNKEFLIQDPDGYLLRFSEDLGEKEV